MCLSPNLGIFNITIAISKYVFINPCLVEDIDCDFWV